MEKQNEPNVKDVGASDGDILTFDEILEDKLYQKEFDRRVSKALETAKTKWEEDAEVKRTEAEKLAKMDADEKAKYELEKERKAKEEALNELNAYRLKEEATKIADGKGVPNSLLNLVHFELETAESIKNKVETIEVEFKQAVEKAVNERLKEKTPTNVVGEPSTTITKSRASY